MRTRSDATVSSWALITCLLSSIRSHTDVSHALRLCPSKQPVPCSPFQQRAEPNALWSMNQNISVVYRRKEKGFHNSGANRNVSNEPHKDVLNTGRNYTEKIEMGFSSSSTTKWSRLLAWAPGFDEGHIWCFNASSSAQCVMYYIPRHFVHSSFSGVTLAHGGSDSWPS